MTKTPDLHNAGNTSRREIIFYDIFYSIFTAFLFLYILIRSSTFRCMEDEAFSLWDVFYMNFGYFFGSMANTHLINSFFLWMDINFLGVNEMVLRFHSVLSFLVYAWAVYKISQQLEEIYKRYLLLLLIMLHPFMIDYFSLARGYAMAVSLMMCSIYFLNTYIVSNDHPLKKNLYKAFLFGGLSVVSCYVLFTYYIAILIVYAAYVFCKDRAAITNRKLALRYWEEKIFWGINSLFSLLIVMILLKMKPASLTDFWPYNSFWGDTIYSLVAMFSLEVNSYTSPAFILLVFLIIVSLAISLTDWYTSGRLAAYSLLSVVFIVMYALFSLQYYIFHIPYLSYRGAVFLYPLVVLIIFWSFAQSKKIASFRKIFMGVLFLLVCMVVINFVFVFSWYRGIGVPPNDFVKAINDLNAARDKEGTVSLGVSGAFPATMNYYKLRYGLDWIKNIGYGYDKNKREIFFYGKEKINAGAYDFFIIEESNIEEVRGFQKIVILKKYPDAGIVLAKSVF